MNRLQCLFLRIKNLLGDLGFWLVHVKFKIPVVTGTFKEDGCQFGHQNDCYKIF